ncbi:MAG: sigma-70 family RNA polymerase sigma factor [Elusimicrobia bacterium]|nr:sigma-70 family RNA polymerase sigma factor [Elusimicrobiota bacterium]
MPDQGSSAGLQVSGPQDIGLVYDRFFRRVYNYVRYRVPDQATAEDVTAQVFEKVLDKLGTYKSKAGPFEPWLFAIARNAVHDHYRSLGWRRWLSLDAVLERPSQDPTPEEALAKDEGLAGLTAGLAKLGGREREILGLKFGAGLGNSEIASMEGLSESNVGVIVFRGLKKLKGIMKGETA